MEFKLEGKCVLTLETKKGEKKSTHIATDFNLEISENLDRTEYLKDNIPTQAGTKCLTTCFVQGLIGNIHHAHEMGYWDSAEHLRYIISELERGFIQVADISKGTF